MLSQNLVPYNQDGLELVIDNQTGESFASISAASRMLNVAHSTLRDALCPSRFGEAKEAEILTGDGLRSSRLLSESQLRTVAKHFAAKGNKTCLDFLDSVADAGIRVYLHSLAGYQVTSTAVELPQPDHVLPTTFLEALKALVSYEEERVALTEQVAVQQPKVELADRFLASDSWVDMKTVANAFGISNIKLFAILRAEGWIFKKGGYNLPYQSHVDNGDFRIFQYTDVKGRLHPSIKVSASGQHAIARLLKKSLVGAA